MNTDNLGTSTWSLSPKATGSPVLAHVRDGLGTAKNPPTNDKTPARGERGALARRTTRTDLFRGQGEVSTLSLRETAQCATFAGDRG